jgi:hypothetical protein
VWSAVFYLFFAWYVPIAAGDRFLAPIVPVLITFAARGVAVLAATSNGASKRPLASRIIWMALLWVIVTTVLSFKSAGQNALDWPKRGDYVRWSWRGVWLDRNDPCPELRTLRETNFLCDGTWPRS